MRDRPIKTSRRHTHTKVDRNLPTQDRFVLGQRVVVRSRGHSRYGHHCTQTVHISLILRIQREEPITVTHPRHRHCHPHLHPTRTNARLAHIHALNATAIHDAPSTSPPVPTPNLISIPHPHPDVLILNPILTRTTSHHACIIGQPQGECGGTGPRPSGRNFPRARALTAERVRGTVTLGVVTLRVATLGVKHSGTTIGTGPAADIATQKRLRASTAPPARVRRGRRGWGACG